MQICSIHEANLQEKQQQKNIIVSNSGPKHLNDRSSQHILKMLYFLPFSLGLFSWARPQLVLVLGDFFSV